MNATAFSGAAAPRSALARPRSSRNALIALAVVALHIGFIWALQSGLVLRAAELIVPATVLSQFIEPPAPKADPAPPTPPVPVVQKKTAIKSKAPAVQPAQPPQPLAVADPTPTPAAPTGTPSEPPLVAAPAQAAPAAAAPAATAPPAMQLPSSNADYLQNPKPVYPALSRRLGEQGRVIVRVLIGIDGTAQKAEIRQSSGFGRLDQAALNTVLKWRYVPGKRAGVPEEMWFNVPLNFVLE